MRKLLLFFAVSLMSVGMFAQGLYTVGFANVPATDKPANVNIVGSFGDDITMELLDNGWFFVKLEASKDDIFKFCDASNKDKILCQKVDGRWIQAVFKFDEKWWDDSWKGDECKMFELDMTDAEQYAWMEGMPDLSAISSMAADAVKGVWFDLNGRKLNGNPAAKGIYIYNGKKLVVK